MVTETRIGGFRKSPVPKFLHKGLSGLCAVNYIPDDNEDDIDLLYDLRECDVLSVLVVCSSCCYVCCCCCCCCCR